jgi:hypothetical protein
MPRSPAVARENGLAAWYIAIGCRGALAVIFLKQLLIYAYAGWEFLCSVRLCVAGGGRVRMGTPNIRRNFGGREDTLARRREC